MTFTEQLEYIRSTMAADLPARLATAGVPDMDEYIAQTPYGDDVRQLAVFLGPGEVDDLLVTSGFLIQIVLPGEENPDKYLTPVLESLLTAVKPSKMGFNSLRAYSWRALYPGDLPEGGSSSFVQIALEYETFMDDCS